MGCNTSSSVAVEGGSPGQQKSSMKPWRRSNRKVMPQHNEVSLIVAGGKKFKTSDERVETPESGSTVADSEDLDFCVEPKAVTEVVGSWPTKMFAEAADHGFLVYGVYSFLPWKQRRDAAIFSKSMNRFFNPRNMRGDYWRWLCECLVDEAKLLLPDPAALPSEVPGSTGSDRLALLARSASSGDFRALLLELWPLRGRFSDREVGTFDETLAARRFRVATYARMRPAAPVALDGFLCEQLLTTPVTLPLGQRVALLRQRRPELSRAEAMRMFINKDCGAAAALPEDDEFMAAVRPATSARPNTASLQGADVSCGSNFHSQVLSTTPGANGSVVTVSPGIGIRSWAFERVFGEASTQAQLYENCGLSLAVNCLNGQSGALIVYGQTGSGKTHTMFGPPQAADGLVPRIADEVLAGLKARRAAGFEVSLGVSMVEVFGNDISNLLGNRLVGANRGQAQRMAQKYVLDGKVQEEVADREAFASLLARGEAQKRKASTEMNERSTRAHTVVIMRLRQRAPGQQREVHSMLSLVDLGGSERVSKSKAHEGIKAAGGIDAGDGEVNKVSWGEYYHSRERLTETNNINQGLLALKRCVQALNKRQRCAKEGKPLPRVPFSDSKLTMLLEPALSGGACTSVVVCCSPEDRHAEETVQSLRFGELCRSVRHAKEGREHENANEAVKEAVKQIDRELREVEAQIRSKEKWEWRRSVREDVIDEKDTGGTVCHSDEVMELGGVGAVEIHADDGSSKKRNVQHEVWSQVLVGAEAENARRDALLKKREQLMGGQECKELD